METRKLTELRPHPRNAEIYGDGCDIALRDSVKKRGVLIENPLIITSPQADIGGNVIISGHRRFNAAQMADLKEVPVTVSEATDTLDVDELLIMLNVGSRDRTNVQIGREFALLNHIETERAKQRQVESGRLYGEKHNKQEVVEIFPQPLVSQPNIKKTVTRMPSNGNGKARDIAAKKLGLSGRSAVKVEKVVKKIDTLKEQGKVQEADILTETLNKSIDKAHRAVKKEEKQEYEIKQHVLSPENTMKKKSTFNATNDNIEWAKWSWNPVTGCEHGCPYCYARDIALRYKDIFPRGFKPHFREDRLNAPVNTKVPERRKDEPGIKNVFVCSMADLFGEWVPDEWIQQVLAAVGNAPQWNFLFLTKNPERYLDERIVFPPNCWVGATADTQERMDVALDVFYQLYSEKRKPTVTFTSCEPLSEEITLKKDNLEESLEHLSLCFDWLIIGGQSKSSGQPAKQPEWGWVESLLFDARQSNVRVYFKPNLTVLPKEYPE